jgi:hypothetical protein
MSSNSRGLLTVLYAHRLRGRGEAINHDADTLEQVRCGMTTGSSISRCNCALLIKLLLKLLVLVVHVLPEAAAMMLNLARAGFFDVEYLALMFWFDVPVSRGRVGHVALDTYRNFDTISLALPPDMRRCIGCLRRSMT